MNTAEPHRVWWYTEKKYIYRQTSGHLYTQTILFGTLRIGIDVFVSDRHKCQIDSYMSTVINVKTKETPGGKHFILHRFKNNDSVCKI